MTNNEVLKDVGTFQHVKIEHWKFFSSSVFVEWSSWQCKIGGHTLNKSYTSATNIYQQLKIEY